MEIGLREWLIVIGIIVISGILFDGWRRMRGGKGKLKFKLDHSYSNLPDDENDPDLGSSRVVERCCSGRHAGHQCGRTQSSPWSRCRAAAG
jgi:cell division protein ZipA